MDFFENKEQDESLFFTNNEVNSYLIETSKWAKFLAIVGFIGMGILILISIFVMFGLSKFSSFSDSGISMGIIGFIYIILAAIYYFPISYLYQFSKQIKNGVNTNDKASVTSGFQNLKSLFKFMGIFTIVVLSIYGLALLIAIPTLLFINH